MDKLAFFHKYILRFDESNFTCTKDFTITASWSLTPDIE